MEGVQPHPVTRAESRGQVRGRVLRPWGLTAGQTERCSQGPGSGGERRHLPQGPGARLAAGGACALRDGEGAVRGAGRRGWRAAERRPGAEGRLHTMASGWLGLRTSPVQWCLRCPCGTRAPSPAHPGLPNARTRLGPGGASQPRGSGAPTLRQRTAPARLASSSPGPRCHTQALASPPAPRLPPRSRFAKGAAPWSADKGPWSVAGSGVPARGPGPRATLAAQLRQDGGYLGRAQGEEPGVLEKTREVRGKVREGPGTKATGNFSQGTLIQKFPRCGGGPGWVLTSS